MSCTASVNECFRLLLTVPLAPSEQKLQYYIAKRTYIYNQNNDLNDSHLVTVTSLWPSGQRIQNWGQVLRMIRE